PQVGNFSDQKWGISVIAVTWTYSVEIWATGPPEIWDHPADQPAGLDNEDGLYNNPRPNSASNDPSELEDG
ncbi:MAG: hypothetical protein OXH54_05480, partial [Acidimicrobiaceae bacterium]|nr:hypothetical protein [Acidimicrobiaceae bacterium]